MSSVRPYRLSRLASLFPVAMVLVSAGMAGARPKAFPDVPLMEGSEPRYVTLALDPWDSKVAYVLLDGNFEQGYRKAYAWIPGDAKYGKPVALPKRDGESFGPLTYESTDRDEKARVQWIVHWRRHAERKGGGTVTRHDYVTGKTRTVERSGRSEHVTFHYSVRYAWGRRTDGAAYPLELSTGGSLGAPDKWEGVGKAVTPWERLRFHLSRNVVRGEEEPRLVLKGTFHNVNVISLPEEARVRYKVSPYRERPIHEDEVDALTMLRDGVAVPVPYGWYYCSWEIESPGLSGRLSDRTHQPFPVSKPYGVDVE